MVTYSAIMTEKSITVSFEDGTTRSLDRSHRLAKDLIEALCKGAPADEVLALMNVALKIARYACGSIVLTEGGDLTYKGEPLHHAVVEEIRKFMDCGLVYEPLIAFLDKLMDNSSHRSVQSLYEFIKHEDITIDSEGNLVCYKAVTSAYLDKHSRTISNKPGQTVTMPRNQIDDDPNSACSQGLHAGSIQYVRGFANPGDRIVTVRVSPADVVSVPIDCDAQKMRICKYEVIADVTDTIIPDKAPSPLYGFTLTDDEADLDLDAEDDGGGDGDGEKDETEVNGVLVRVPTGMHLDISVDDADGRTVVTVTE